MRLGPFRLNHQRAARALAGLVAAFLLTGNVLAAAGLCAIKAPAASHEHASMMKADAPADEVACSEHRTGGTAPASNTHHCPTEDPSAQSRTVDIPAAQIVVAMAASLLNWPDATLRSEPPVVFAHPAAPQPLYTRLQRLRL